MQKSIDQIIEELNNIVKSDTYFVGSERGIKSSDEGSNWFISNLSNHSSNYTAPINSFEEAAIIISKVSESEVQVTELSNRFQVDLKLPLFLHLM